jgi:dTDP-4-amino-4,6-dideoxygalactose transaminase
MNIPFSKPFVKKIHDDTTILPSQVSGKMKIYGYETETLMTVSATGALEMMGLLLDLKAGDEVILPSFTYAATANAFARTGAKLIFGDIDPDTMNLDPVSVEGAVTDRTKAIIPIHYGGVSADMDKLTKIGHANNIPILEDAAHCIGAKNGNRLLGTIGDMGCLSFHPTKNISCGRGGTLFINREFWEEPAKECLHQGTDRMAFYRGDVSEYTWQRLGGAYTMNPYSLKALYETLDFIEAVTLERQKVWQNYYDGLKTLEDQGVLNLAKIPKYATFNAHIFYVLTPYRQALLNYLSEAGIQAYTHYEPLHLTKIGQKLSENRGRLSQTEKAASELLRLPIYSGMTEMEQAYVIEKIKHFFK